MVIYVCYVPRAWADDKNLAKKKKAFEEGRVSSHWPHRIKLFAKTPRLYSGENAERVKRFIESAETRFARPNLTDFGKKLTGF